MLKLKIANQEWWRKPLVLFKGRVLPAELAILCLELRPGEKGAWMNSRGTDTGVVNLVPSHENGRGSYVTCREELPEFVSKMLKRTYRKAGVKKGGPDIVIWKAKTRRTRFVEVKCPHWDRLTREQERFLAVAESAGIPTKIVEWEFRGKEK